MIDNERGQPNAFAMNSNRMYNGIDDRAHGNLEAPSYGATANVDNKVSEFFARSQRQTLNIIPVFQCLFGPWILFCVVYALLSFRIHHSSPGLCWTLVVLCLVPVVYFGVLTARTVLRRLNGDFAPKAPSWFTFVFVSTLVAWSLGVVFGGMNFWTNMQPFYVYSNLNFYKGLSPAMRHGQEVMDGGRVIFTNDTALDIRLSMGLRNQHTYCVVPISVRSSAGIPIPLENYDFWAVGLDCCSSGATAGFQCGEYANPKAHQGLRLLREDDRAFFRLAVQQAEAAHNIQATHPLFFRWTEDATAEMNLSVVQGNKFYFIGMLVHFLWQALIVSLAAAAFAKLSKP